jgi:FkbM family methyltransferase
MLAKILDKGSYYVLRALSGLIMLIIIILDLLMGLFRPRLKERPFLTRGPLLQSYLASVISSPRSIKVSDKLIKFDCLGVMPLYRANTAASKEPETISWIEQFSDELVMWDIGANVGVYSLFAGATGMRVLAFEPSAPNYFALNRNIELNGLSDKILAFSLALYSKTGISRLHMGDTEVGGAFNSLSESNYSGVEFEPTFYQGSLGITIDQLAEIGGNENFPNIIKIDVDGNELHIIKGAKDTLRDPRLKSILIELTDANNELDDVKNILKQAGFAHVETHETGRIGRAEEIIIQNCIFVRNEAQ